ncbi:MAG: putative membrane protein, partial [Sphingobacteriales bacterium]
MENSRKPQLLLYLKGIAMGAADVVPGVSGGTIALITGIYQELIDTIKGVDISVLKILLKGNFKEFWSKLNGNFLITLFTGIATSVLLISSGMIYLLKNYPEQLWGFFLGLIIASAWLVGKKVTTWNIGNITSLIIG